MKNNVCDYPFIRYPKAFIDSPSFSHISIEACLLFALILDRFSLSSINSDKFTDEHGDLFIIYTLEEVCEKLRCSSSKAIRVFRELEAENLIIRKRKYCCMPYKIYIAERFSEFAKTEFATAENHSSRVNEITIHELTKTVHNKTDNIYTDISKTHSSVIGFERTEEEIKEQIEYECIVCDANRNLLDETVMIIFDVLNGTSPTVRIGKDDMPRGVVISRFCKLNSEHIFYIFSKLDRNETRIKNIKSYLITMLYNAPATMETDVTAEYAFHHKKQPPM